MSERMSIEELEAAVRADPGAEEFAELAEWHRRAGRLDDAERVARRGLERRPEFGRGRAVLALVLLDAGRSDELRQRLEGWLDAAAPAAPPVLFPEAEFDRAFDAAEPELDAMITPDSVAEEAALRVDGAFATVHPLEGGGTFATRTMADLLERQGDAEGAARIRASLGAARAAPAPEAASAEAPADDGRLATLERWLTNARSMQS